MQDILPEATIVDNGKVLGIANGKWTKVAMNEGVSQEYVDNAIAGITDWTTGADEDISNLLERTEAIETDVETIKQGYVTVGYVNEKTQNIPAIKEDIETLKTDAETFKEYFEVINTSYATKKYVDDAVASSGGGTGGVSSWNDLTDKPFGTEEAWQELMSNSVCTFTRNADMGNACVYITTLTTEMLEKFKGDWNKAFVVWDEVEYECNPKLAFGATKGIGNVGFFDGTEDSGEPFLIMVDDGTNTGGSPVAIIISVEDSKNAIETATHSVGISLMVETIHPIDTKFIDNISWNKISDKPFYDEGTKTVTLDYANPPAVRVDLMGDPLYKVTDDILTEADINSANISLSGTIGGIDTNFSQELNVDTATVAYTFTFGAIYEFDYEVNGTTVAIMIAVATQTGEFEEMGISVNIAETGTYIDCSFISGEGTINSISLEYGDDLKTLEAKYLDIINCEPDKILVTQQQLTFTGDEADGFYIDINGISFIEGKTYKVIWDGTEYTYNAFNNGNVVAIGDTNTLLAWNEDTGIRIWTADSSPSHTVTITKVESCEIKEEYLPDSLYTYIDNAVGEVDLSDYAKLEDINNKADKSEIPTKVSQLINDSGYISEHQSLEGFATEPYVDYQVARIEGNLSSEIAVERARINTFTALEDGSTTGDAELQDIRVGADGTVYESAGASVRGQINQINDVVFYDEIEKDITDTLTIENGYYYTKGFTKVAQNGLGCTNIIPVKSGDKFKISAKYGYYAVLVAEFDTSNTMISYTGQVDGKEAVATDYEYTVPNGVSGIAVSTRDTKYNPIKVIKIAKENVKNRIKTLEDLSELSLVATNQVVDKSEWTATGGALTFEGDTAIVTADKSNVRVGVNAKFGECKNGDTLFFKANIKAPWGVGGTEQQNKPEIIMWVNASTGLKDVTRCILPNIEQNDYYGNIAFDCDVNGTPLLCSVLYNNVNVIPTNAQIEVKDIVVVNLTKVFGAGNEPTAEEFYSLLNCFENKYFEGEKNLFSASANLRRIYNDYKSTLLTEDITVTVGANGDFETLNGAISYLSSFYPAYKKGGIKCYIKILEGTVINEQIFANQIDLQYITIIAEGNTETISIDGTSYTMNIVDVNATGFKHTANAHDARGNYPFIAGENAAKLPTIGCVFRLMPETVEDGKTVCGMLCNRGSEGVVLAASGFDGFNDGVIANNESSITIREGISRNMTRWGVHARHNGEVSARSCVCTNCGIGACADRVADCDVREAVLNGSKVAIECNNISRVNANGCHAQNCGTNGGYVVMISGGGFANCGSLDTTGYVGTLYNKATNTLSSSGIIFV